MAKLNVVNTRRTQLGRMPSPNNRINQSSRPSFVERFVSAYTVHDGKKVVANLWTEFAAQHSEALVKNRKEPQNPNKLVVAATCEVAKT